MMKSFLTSGISDHQGRDQLTAGYDVQKSRAEHDWSDRADQQAGEGLKLTAGFIGGLEAILVSRVVG